MADTLPCENGGGSINNPNNPGTTPTPYTPPALCRGTWEITGTDPDECAINDQRRQETYVAETLNISGAPINVYKLLGVHEQGTGSLLSKGKLFASQSYPGFPLTNVNGAGSWKSLESGINVANTSFIGLDFGIKLLSNGLPANKPNRPNLIQIGSINITQANTPNEFAKQVKVEIADGSCEFSGVPIFTGIGNGTISTLSLGQQPTRGSISIIATSSSTFDVMFNGPDGIVILPPAAIDVPYSSTYVNFLITGGSVPYAIGDIFSISLVYKWRRVGIFNLIQSPLPQTLNLQSLVYVKAVRVIPTLFSGTGNWEISGLDVLDTIPTDINNIQDLFFNENRDRDYALTPVPMKVQYSPTDSLSDLAKFGLSILDQYAFTISFANMVTLLGRPIVVGDIIEVIPEMQWDQNLKPIRKFVEVTDTGWASEGYSSAFKPTLYRVAAVPALPSQETRDIFGTMDTQKYLIADSVLSGDFALPLDHTPLTQTEEIIKAAQVAVPEVGSDDGTSVKAVKIPPNVPPANPKGNVTIEKTNNGPNLYIEDGLPPDGIPYGEGFKLPDALTVSDGDYFRLLYAPEANIAPRLYRFSAIKNRWIFMEQDRRGVYSSHKPSVRQILESDTKIGLGKKF